MATITNIDATDLITDSRADINNNFANLNTDKIETSTLDTDTTLAADSDAKIATQKAVKAYVDAGGNVNATETTKGIVEVATAAEVAAGTPTGGTGASLVVTPDNLPTTDVQLFTTNGTWTKPEGALTVTVQLLGPGGAGGSGHDDSADAEPGGGGGGGGYSEFTFKASDLSATEAITVDTGADSTFGATKLVAGKGAAGTDGTASVPGPGGEGGSGNIENGGDGGDAIGAGSGNGGSGASTKMAGPGGGSGGASPEGGTSGAGGGVTVLEVKAVTPGVTGNTVGTAGTANTISFAAGSAGSGGNSGSNDGLTDGRDGGAGGGYGSGGGGGGGCDNAGGGQDPSGGDGGAGTGGAAQIITYF